MPYIGAPLISTNFVLDQFTATAGQTAFTLTQSPASVQSVLVMIDGVVQEPGVAYTLSGTSLTMSSGVPLNAKVYAIHLGVRGTVTAPAAGSVNYTTLDTTLNGAVVQTAYAEYATNADLTTPIPYDDTIPQNTEGTEILQVSITPRSATNTMVIRVQGFGSLSAGNDVLGWAIFQDTVANAIVAGASTQTGGAALIAAFAGEFRHSPATASAITYKLRVGPTGGTLRMNGIAAQRRYGGVAKTTLIIQEIKA